MAKSNGKRVRRWLWIGALGLAIAGAGFAFARPKGKPGEEKDKVKTAKAEVADVQVRVTEVGSVEPDVKVDVKSVLSGKVVELLVREGDRVKRGQVLARVEPDVNQARDLVQVKNSVSEAEIALTEAKATYERNKGLLAQGLLSAQAGLESETRYRQSKASRDSAMDKYRIVEESGVPIAVGLRGHHAAAQRHLAHGRGRDPAPGRARRHRHVRRLVLQRGHRPHDRGRREHDDHRGRHQRGGHRQGPARAAGEGHPRRLPEGEVRGEDPPHRPRRAPRGEGEGLRRRDRDRAPGSRAAHRA